jgi:hypothetical protein
VISRTIGDADRHCDYGKPDYRVPTAVEAQVPDPVPASEFYHAVRPVPDGPPDTFKSNDRVVISPRFAAQWSLEEYEDLDGVVGTVVISECGQTLVSFDPPNRYAKRPTLTFTNPYMLTKLSEAAQPDEQPTGGKPARSPVPGKDRKGRKGRGKGRKFGEGRKAGMVPAEPRLIRRPKPETVETVGTAQVVLTVPTVRTAATVQTPEEAEGLRKVETVRLSQNGSRKRRRTSAGRFR